MWEAEAAPTAEAMSVEQCRRVKELNPKTKCWVYRNTELAFAALTTDRRLMNPEGALLFIGFKDPAACKAAPCPPTNRSENFCCPFANVYEEGNPGWGRFTQFPTQKTMRLFLWDYRNPKVVKYFVESRILGADLGLGNPAVDGFFTDDPVSARPTCRL